MDDDPPITKEAYLHAARDMANLPPEPSRQPAATPPTTAPAAEHGPPSTSSVLWAAWRQGLKDLQTAVLGAWGGSHEETGTIANPVHMEIYQDRHHESPTQEMQSYEQNLHQSAQRHHDRDRSRSR